jgi:hypothetical protein
LVARNQEGDYRQSKGGKDQALQSFLLIFSGNELRADAAGSGKLKQR